MIQPRANIGQWVPGIGDPSPFGDITLAINSRPGITYVEGPDGHGVHFSEEAQRTLRGYASSLCRSRSYKRIAPHWAGQIATRRIESRQPIEETHSHEEVYA